MSFAELALRTYFVLSALPVLALLVVLLVDVSSTNRKKRLEAQGAAQLQSPKPGV